MRFLIGFERDLGVQGRGAMPDSERSVVDARAARRTDSSPILDLVQVTLIITTKLLLIQSDLVSLSLTIALPKALGSASARGDFSPSTRASPRRRRRRRRRRRSRALVV